MKTVDYLSKVNTYNRMIQNKTAEIRQLQIMACSISAVTIDENKVQKSSDQDRLGSAVARIIDEENETQKTIDELFAKRDKIIKQIDSLSEINADMYDVLTLKFVQCMRFKEIEDCMQKSTTQVKRIYNSALVEFEYNYGEEYLSKRSKVD